MRALGGRSAQPIQVDRQPRVVFRCFEKRSFEQISQLTNVSRKSVSFQCGQTLRSDQWNGAAVLLRYLPEQQLGQAGDVVQSRPERRDLNGKHIQTEHQVLPKASGVDLVLERSVGRRDHASLKLPNGGAAERPVFARVKKPQQFCLQGQGNFGDFIQK